MTLRDQAAVVGVGATQYYKRGRSLPQTPFEMAGKAMLGALEDAGLTVADVDGLALYSFAALIIVVAGANSVLEPRMIWRRVEELS